MALLFYGNLLKLLVIYLGGMGDDLDYVFILKSLREIPFGVGKKLLIAFLRGDKDNESIGKNKLYNLKSFGSLAYTDGELGSMIDGLVMNGMIQTSAVNGNAFWKVLELSSKGRKEIDEPSLYKRKLSFSFKQSQTVITDDDKKIFGAFGDFLLQYNDAQKKAIIGGNKHILCIAGAGSGKTTVLTKRIEFLVKYKSVDPSKILAITFTRKARQEMMKRLVSIGGLELVRVETFNSFCEGMLRQHGNLVYGKSVRVISYRDKIMIVNRALSKLGMDMGRVLDIYFSFAQRRGKTSEQLANIFMNDCFFIRDYFKFKNLTVEKSSFDINLEHIKSLNLIIDVCKFIEEYMGQEGLRDFADQLIDTLSLFEKHKNLIPSFGYVLIDEYQDVNSTQIKLIDLICPENLFAVGDPRQSIYGWRGSDIRYILNFEEKYPGCDIVTLTKNYRSTSHIVELINKSIRSMNLADLESVVKGKKEVKLLKFDSEETEFKFVIRCIINSKLERNEIFVLARTNRQLNELSQLMKVRGVKHIVRSDEMKTAKNILPLDDEITLATVHAIKGLEAHTVFVVGCTGTNFPCRGSEHPVIEMVKIEEYDKEEEERRLFYVAMSRAKHGLYLSYSGKKPTHFITDEMMSIFGENKMIVENEKENEASSVKSDGTIIRLKEWRSNLSKVQGLPAYIIMHDRTLFDIAVKMPMSVGDLEQVFGLGPTKIKRYGEDILQIVNGEK
jgi:superfamily I DNA/RNA helicase